MTTTISNHRDQLIANVAANIEQTIQQIEQDRNAALDAKNEARRLSDYQDNGGAQQAIALSGKYQEAVRAGEAKLRDLELQRENIVRGPHPDLVHIGLNGTMKSSGVNQAELLEARAAFVAVLTPEVRAAAKRFVKATAEADPLTPVPTLASMLMDGI
jgi:hypothetical protein